MIKISVIGNHSWKKNKKNLTGELKDTKANVTIMASVSSRGGDRVFDPSLRIFVGDIPPIFFLQK